MEEVNDVITNIGFTSNVIIELHSENGKYKIVLKYNGKKINVFKGKSELDLDSFLMILNKNTDKSFD